MARGGAHFPSVEETVLRAAAKMVANDRLEIAKRGVCPPGGAEYLDLLRAVAVRWPGEADQQAAALQRIGAFALRKHPEAAAW